MSTHEHTWKLGLHIDGCHYFASTYSCECGATRGSYDERDFSEPYSTIWALEECERCQELMHGATPEHRDNIELPA